MTARTKLIQEVTSTMTHGSASYSPDSSGPAPISTGESEHLGN